MARPGPHCITSQNEPASIPQSIRAASTSLLSFALQRSRVLFLRETLLSLTVRLHFLRIRPGNPRPPPFEQVGRP